MKYCKKCQVSVTGEHEICPLCQNKLSGNKNSGNVFPKVVSIFEEQNILFKILLFISIITIATSVIINLLISTQITWAWFIIITLLLFWFTFITSINKRHNPNIMIFKTILIAAFGSIIYDYLTGFHLWSITYVLPLLCIIAVFEIIIVSLILKYKVHDFISYLIGANIIGIIPIVSILFKAIDVTWPSVLCFTVNFVAIVTIFFFGTTQSKKELKKKYHI